MKLFFASCLGAVLFFTVQVVQAQHHLDLHHAHPSEDYENVHIQKLDSDPRVSTFLIWVKESVKEHYHKDHTEVVYVLEGTGTLMLGEREQELHPGDYIFIPPGTRHSVKVTSKDPMKVISVQTPEFDGSDRVFVTQ